MKRMNLSRQMELEFPVRVPDGAGGFVEHWVILGKTWAAVEIRGAGREDATTSSMSLKISVRYEPFGALMRPTTEMRFRDGARSYSIQAVHETDPSNRYLTCFATEEVGL